MRERKAIDYIVLLLDSLISEGEYVRYDLLCETLIDGDKILSHLEYSYPRYFDFGMLTRKERELIELIIMEALAVKRNEKYPPKSNGLKYLMDSCIMGSCFLEKYKRGGKTEAVA